jgi:hypothetical protein
MNNPAADVTTVRLPALGPGAVARDADVAVTQTPAIAWPWLLTTVPVKVPGRAAVIEIAGTDAGEVPGASAAMAAEAVRTEAAADPAASTAMTRKARIRSITIRR